MLENSTIWKVKQTVKTAALANLTIWKANRTKQSLVKTAVLANSTIWKVKQTVKTAALANSTIWKANQTKAVACKNCSLGKFNDLEGQSNCKNCGVGKFNDLEGDEAVACKIAVGKFNVWKVSVLVKTAVLANLTMQKVNRTNQ